MCNLTIFSWQLKLPEELAIGWDFSRVAFTRISQPQPLCFSLSSCWHPFKAAAHPSIIEDKPQPSQVKGSLSIRLLVDGVLNTLHNAFDIRLGVKEAVACMGFPAGRIFPLQRGLAVPSCCPSRSPLNGCHLFHTQHQATGLALGVFSFPIF